MAKKNIFIHTRYDYPSKKGGDTDLLNLLSNLIKEKHHVEIGNINSRNLNTYDLVISSNLDRPVEAYALLKKCKKLGVKFALYTLHHPYDGIKEYLRKGVYGKKKFIAYLSAYNPTNYELLAWLSKVLIHTIKFKKILPFSDIKKSQSYLLSKSDYILVTSEKEKKTIENDIGKISGEIIFLPHILTENKEEIVKGKKNKNLTIICPGRIESRKNQIRVLEASGNFPNFNFKFIGGINKNEKDYCQRFLKQIEKKHNCTHHNHMPPKQFKKAMQESDIIISATWFEVTSLIELNALQLRKPLISGKYSYISYFYPNSTNIDPSSSDSISKAIELAVKNIEKPQDMLKYPSKEDILETLYSIIE